MRKFLIAALICAAAAQADAKTAGCSLQIAKTEAFSGSCEFDADKDGSFRLFSPSGYFVYVSVSAPGQADGYWNGWDKDRHAHTGLGVLVREEKDRACWSNGYARVCAR